jgi:uncharacterized RDD family membrane protein YckC
MSKYAGFPIRFLAYILEPFFYWMVFAYFMSQIAMSQTLADLWQGLIMFLVFIALPFALINPFLRAFFSSHFGGNIGKLLTGLRVEDSDHKNLSFKRSFFRYTAGYIFSGVLFFLGFFCIIKDPKKQGFHDKAVGSYVTVRQTLWPLALVLLIAFTFGIGYFWNQAFNRLMDGPLKFEVVGLFLQYQEEAKPVPENPTPPLPSPSLSPIESTSSAVPGTKTSPSPKAATNVIFVALKEGTTAEQAKPLMVGIQANPSVTNTQFLTKEEATQAYQTYAPGHTLPMTNLTPIIIIFLKDTKNNTTILSQLKSNSLVFAAYPYSF